MRHYFSGDAPLQPSGLEERLEATFVNEVLSPAEVEAMCAEFDDPVEMVMALERRFCTELGVSVSTCTSTTNATARPPEAASCMKVVAALEG